MTCICIYKFLFCLFIYIFRFPYTASIVAFVGGEGVKEDGWGFDITIEQIGM